MALGMISRFREKIPYLYIVRIDEGAGKVFLFPLKRGNSAVMIERGGDQDFYLYHVIYMLSLRHRSNRRKRRNT